MPVNINLLSDDTIAKGITPPDVGNFGTSFAATQDYLQKQAQQDVFRDKSLYDPVTGQLDFQKAARKLLEVGGAPALQNYLGLQKYDVLSKLPPIDSSTLSYPTERPRVALPPSPQRGGTLQTEPSAEDSGDGPATASSGVPLPKGKLGNLGPVLGVEVNGQPTAPASSFTDRFAGESQQPDDRYPPQFQVQPKPVPTETIRPQSALPQEALDARAEVPQRQAQATIPGIPTQQQGQYTEAAAQEQQRIANQALENARRAAFAGDKETADIYKAKYLEATGNAKMIREGLIKTQGEQAGVQIKQEEAVLNEGRKGYEAAKNTQFRLGLINDNIKNLGPEWMGAGANARATAARSWNTARNLLPKDVQDVIPEINSEKIANWEDFNKQTQTLGFELAKTLGSREAMQIVQQATASVPNAQQTYWGARLVSSAMGQAAQRQEDYMNYLIKLRRSGQSMLDADVTFNQRNPVSSYIKRAVSVVPPQPAIEALRTNPTPAMIKAFDGKYGDGASIGAGVK